MDDTNIAPRLLRIKRAIFSRRRPRNRKRPTRTVDDICTRKSDGSLWVPGCQQNLGLCFSGLFVRRERGDWFFMKARWHRGTLIVAQRIFWLPKQGEFDLTHRNVGTRAVCMPRLPEPIESDLYHQRMEVRCG